MGKSTLKPIHWHFWWFIAFEGFISGGKWSAIEHSYADMTLFVRKKHGKNVQLFCLWVPHWDIPNEGICHARPAHGRLYSRGPSPLSYPIDKRIIIPLNVGKTIIKHPSGNGKHTIYKNGDDWGMVQMALFYPQKANHLPHGVMLQVGHSLITRTWWTSVSGFEEVMIRQIAGVQLNSRWTFFVRMLQIKQLGFLGYARIIVSGVTLSMKGPRSWRLLDVRFLRRTGCSFSVAHHVYHAMKSFATGK